MVFSSKQLHEHSRNIRIAIFVIVAFLILLTGVVVYLSQTTTSSHATAPSCGQICVNMGTCHTACSQVGISPSICYQICTTPSSCYVGCNNYLKCGNPSGCNGGGGGGGGEHGGNSSHQCADPNEKWQTCRSSNAFIAKYGLCDQVSRCDPPGACSNQPGNFVQGDCPPNTNHDCSPLTLTSCYSIDPTNGDCQQVVGCIGCGADQTIGTCPTTGNGAQGSCVAIGDTGCNPNAQPNTNGSCCGGGSCGTDQYTGKNTCYGAGTVGGCSRGVCQSGRCVITHYNPQPGAPNNGCWRNSQCGSADNCGVCVGQGRICKNGQCVTGNCNQIPKKGDCLSVQGCSWNNL